MALDYNSLVTRVVDIIKDTTVTSSVAEQFIEQSQPKIQRDLMSKVYGGEVPRQMLARADLVSDSNSQITLPSDYFDVRSVLVGSNIARYASPEKVRSSSNGYADADVALDYYQQIPTLTSSNTTNWLIEISEDVYIWGACIQYAPWGAEFESNMGRFNPFYEDAIRKTKSANGVTPLGGFTRQKGRPYGPFYTVIGANMLFDRAS